MTHKPRKKPYSIRLCWLYPDLMNTYGDRGNIIALQRRCQWRDISIEVIEHTVGSPHTDIQKADLIFMGGAQDRQQEVVARDMTGRKARALRERIDSEVPGLYICGAYQFLGKYYKSADGKKIEGLGIFDVHTVHPGDQKKRLVGNIVIQPDLTHFDNSIDRSIRFVGFENHGGRTYLGKDAQGFSRVVKGHGNNGEDGTEGIIFENSIGSYLHGPLLPKNPEIADWLIKKALEKKYDEKIQLKRLRDTLESKARDYILKQLS